MKTGTELITEERQRQISQEGWTAEHDDTHRNGALAHAACAYALPHATAVTFRGGNDADLDFCLTVWPRHFWPWEKDGFKRSMIGPTPHEDRIRELTKAGALIAAEIDRLHRAALAAAEKEGK